MFFITIVENLRGVLNTRRFEEECAFPSPAVMARAVAQPCSSSLGKNEHQARMAQSRSIFSLPVVFAPDFNEKHKNPFCSPFQT